MTTISHYTPAQVERLIAKRSIAQRREARAVARLLVFKADVYGPAGRIFSFQGKWKAKGDSLSFTQKGVETIYRISELSDGHGRGITSDSSY